MTGIERSKLIHTSQSDMINIHQTHLPAKLVAGVSANFGNAARTLTTEQPSAGSRAYELVTTGAWTPASLSIFEYNQLS